MCSIATVNSPLLNVYHTFVIYLTPVIGFKLVFTFIFQNFHVQSLIFCESILCVYFQYVRCLVGFINNVTLIWALIWTNNGHHIFATVVGYKEARKLRVFTITVAKTLAENSVYHLAQVISLDCISLGVCLEAFMEQCATGGL